VWWNVYTALYNKFPAERAVKECLKSVKIWQNYCQSLGLGFSGTRCSMCLLSFQTQNTYVIITDWFKVSCWFQVTSGTMWYWAWFGLCRAMRLRKHLQSAGASVTWASLLTNIRWTLHWRVQGLDWSLLVSNQQFHIQNIAKIRLSIKLAIRDLLEFCRVPYFHIEYQHCGWNWSSLTTRVIIHVVINPAV